MEYHIPIQYLTLLSIHTMMELDFNKVVVKLFFKVLLCTLIIVMCEFLVHLYVKLYKIVILYSTFRVQCTSLTGSLPSMEIQQQLITSGAVHNKGNDSI